MFTKSLLVAASLFISANSFAGCWTDCVTRVFGKCVLKTKICNIGDDPAGAMRTNFRNFQEDVVNVWHDVYGTLPEQIRVILNNHTFVILGAAYGGLDYAAMGLALDRLVFSTKLFSANAKQAIDNAHAQLQAWKEEYILQVEGLKASFTMATIANGKTVNGINFLQIRMETAAQDALFCIENANSKDEAYQCTQQFIKASADVLSSAVS